MKKQDENFDALVIRALNFIYKNNGSVHKTKMQHFFNQNIHDYRLVEGYVNRNGWVDADGISQWKITQKGIDYIRPKKSIYQWADKNEKLIRILGVILSLILTAVAIYFSRK